MLAANIIPVNSGDDSIIPARPWPVGIRDISSDRLYEVADEWARVKMDESRWTPDMHQALREQAVTEAEGTISDELGQAEEAMKRMFGLSTALANVRIERVGGRVEIVYAVCACCGPKGEALSGKGATVWEAIDDLRACAAEQLPAVAEVA